MKQSPISFLAFRGLAALFVLVSVYLFWFVAFLRVSQMDTCPFDSKTSVTRVTLALSSLQ